jgi:hypothetical protein
MRTPRATQARSFVMCRDWCSGRSQRGVRKADGVSRLKPGSASASEPGPGFSLSQQRVYPLIATAAHRHRRLSPPPVHPFTRSITRIIPHPPPPTPP